MSKPIGINCKEELNHVFDHDSKPKLRPLSSKMKKKLNVISEQDLLAIQNGFCAENEHTLNGTSKNHVEINQLGKKQRRFFKMNGHSHNHSDEPPLHEAGFLEEDRYFVNGVSSSPPKEAGIIREGTFAGRRDVLNPRSIEEQALVSAKGTVRGFKNRVRAGIATFLSEEHTESNFRQSERGKIVIYTTSMSVIRGTYEQCKRVKSLLQNHMVRYEERDVYMNKDHQKELVERMGSEEVEVPQVFADGQLIGGAKRIEQLNELGELRKVFKHFKKVHVKSNCAQCGGYRFMPCGSCHGSKKSFHRNNFTDEFHSLRCMQCNENGLVRCDLCLDQQE